MRLVPINLSFVSAGLLSLDMDADASMVDSLFVMESIRSGEQLAPPMVGVVIGFAWHPFHDALSCLGVFMIPYPLGVNHGLTVKDSAL